MTQGWKSIAFSTALGAFIGGLAALEFGGQFAWILGALLGGIVAYVAVDFRHLCKGVAHAYRKTIAWRPNKAHWKIRALACGAYSMSTIWLAVGTHLISEHHEYSRSFQEALFGATAMVLFALALGIFVGTIVTQDYLKKSPGDRARVQGQVWEVLRWGNPVGLAWATALGAHWVAVRLPYAMGVAATYGGKGAKLFAEFMKMAFILVHSQRRTICFVDATIGAAVGYSLGSALIGAIAGALLGVINYEIVSIRILKLAPATR